MKRHWNFLESRVAYQNRIVEVREETYCFVPNGIVRDFTVLGFADWVNIIPITPDGKVVMIRQYRLGTRSETLEIPGGLISEDDADPAEAALREMIEETGYYSGEVVHTGQWPNPAIQNNCLHLSCCNAVPVPGRASIPRGRSNWSTGSIPASSARPASRTACATRVCVSHDLQASSNPDPLLPFHYRRPLPFSTSCPPVFSLPCLGGDPPQTEDAAPLEKHCPVPV